MLFPISGRVAGGTERKTEKMMKKDLATTRKNWIKEGKSKKKRMAREKTDFLAYCNDTGYFADFHANRHFVHHELGKSGGLTEDGADIGAA